MVELHAQRGLVGKGVAVCRADAGATVAQFAARPFVLHLRADTEGMVFALKTVSGADVDIMFAVFFVAGIKPAPYVAAQLQAVVAVERNASA